MRRSLAPLENEFTILNMQLQQLQKRRLAGEKLQLEGEIIYDKILDQICKLLPRIKTTPPITCLAKDFKKNFHKLFIDRSRFDKPRMTYDAFNRHDKSGNDLCYSEGFALGFLTMLHKVVELKKRGDVVMSSAEFIAFFIEVNAVVTAKNPRENLTQTVMKSGNLAQFLQAKKRKEIQDQFGKSNMIYDFSNGQLMTIFDKDFDHEKAVRRFYEDYCEVMKDVATPERAICELVDLISSHAHLCKDGNNRSAILCGWLLALSNNIFLPTLVNQFRVTDETISEGSTWIREFMRNPEIEALSQDSARLDRKITSENFSDFEKENPAAFFLFNLFKTAQNSGCCVSLQEKSDEILISYSRNYFVGDVKIVESDLQLLLENTDQDKKINPRFLYEALSEMPVDARDDHQIACAFMKKICENLSELEEGDKALCESVIAKHASQSAEFKEIASSYLAVFPQYRVGNFEAAKIITRTENIRI